jgi:hypothetical protein
MLSLFLLTAIACKAQNIRTIAGAGTSSYSGDGGPATLAELGQPVSVAYDASGNVYISDQGNHRIRKITYSTGNISTVAGTTTSGYSGDGGLATAAQLYYPSGIAVDGSGNIYFADQYNQRIRKVTASTGVITTIAGTGTAGFSGDGGAATLAQLDNPVGVALDASGNVYISDQYNQRIRKITVSTGNINTIAGTGTYSFSGDGGAATAATFQNPAGLELDASGNIYIADLFNHRIRKITASTGFISTVAGSGTAGYSGDGSSATSANINYPTDVSLDDSGNIYISVQYSHRIRKVSATTGNISTVIGTGTAGYSGDGGPATLANINYPTGIASDAGGNLYVADRENHRIRFVCNYTFKPTVTTPVTYCVGATATALTATGTSLKWFTSLTAYSGTTTAPTPSTATAGTTKYYVASISPYGCEGPRDSISVVVNALPAAPVVTTPITYCTGETATALTATGTGLLWYTTATGGTGSSTAPTPSTTTAGTAIYYVSQTSTTTICESPRASITVNVTSSASAPSATTAVNYCEGATAAALTATGTSLKWYTVATGGTALSGAPTPSTAAAGTTTYYVSQTTACGESPRTAITVTVNAKPTAPTVTSPVEYCQYATASALTGTGTSLKWYTVASGGTALSGAPTPSTGSAGSTIYYVSQTSTSGCESARASITVTINAAPAAPAVSSPVNYCVGASATTLTASGTSLKWYTVSTGGTALSGAPTPSTGSAGTTTYYVSQTSGIGCEGLRAAIAVIVTAIPGAPTVSSPVNLCVGAIASALTATGTSLLWYTVASGGTGSTAAPTPSTSATGITTYYVSQTNGCGESVRASITVNVNPTPTAPVVTSPLTYCQYETAAPLTASGTSLKWYTTPSGGSSTGAPTPNTGTPGTTTYYVSQTNSSNCESSRSAIEVIVKPAPTPPVVVSPVNYCVGAVSIPLSATGTNLLWYTTASGGTGSTTAPTPSTATVGTTTYYVSQTNDTTGCTSMRASIVVNVYDVPARPAVVSPRNYCVGAASVALTATGTSLKWYSSATGGTGSTTAPVTVTTTTGTFKYYVSQTSAFGCGESARDSIVVNINAIPAPPTVTTPVSYCAGDIATALSASGTTLKWYTVATGGTGSTTTPTPSTTTAGTYKFYVSQTSAANCESARDSITVTINAKPAAPTVTTPVSYCVGATAVPLVASGTSLKWYMSASGGTASTITPTPSTGTAGTTTYYVSQSSGLSCEGPRASIVVTINAIPAKPTFSTPVNFCIDATSTSLSATGTSIKWYTSASGGTGSTTAPIPSTSTLGTQKFYVSQTVSTCESIRDSITVNVNPRPAAPAVITPVTYCAGETASALSATGTSLKWYMSATGGTGSSTTPVPSTATAGTTKYYVSQTNGFTCEGARDSITVTINTTPAAPIAASPVEYCSGTPATALSATGTSLKWYTTASGGTASTVAPTPTTTATGTTTYYVTQSNSLGCESARTPVNVIVYATPSAPTVGFFIILCLGETRTLTATGSGLKWYSTPTGGTGSTTAPTPSTATPGSEYFYVSQTSSAGCEGPRATILVSVDTILSAPTVTTPVTYCQNATAAALVSSGTSLHWYKDAPTGTYTTTPPVPSTATGGSTKYYVCKVSSAGCEGYKDSITVVINPLPAAPIVTTPVSYCEGTAATALSASGTSLKWYTVATGGTGSTTAITPSTATAGTTLYYVSQTSALNCEGPRASISVTVNPLPSAPTVTSPVNYCKDAIASALTATGTSLKWYTVPSGGTGSSTAPTPSTASTGTTIYYVSQTSAAICEGPRAAISVVINPLPSAPTVTTPVNYCKDATAVALTATGVGLKWYTSATGGTGISTAPTPATTTVGTTTYYVTQTNASTGCESIRSAIDVSINPIPSAPVATSPVNYCVGDIPVPLTATGSSLKWYNTATGGIASATAPTPSAAVAGSTTYYVSQTSLFNCESPRTAITVVVTNKPDVLVTPVGTPYFVYCKNDTVRLKASSSVALSYYQWYKDDTLIPGATADIYKAFRNGRYKVVVKNSFGCQHDTTVYVFGDTLPEPTLSPIELQFCPNVNIILFCKPALPTYKYEWVKDGLIVPGATGSQLIINKAGDYYVNVINSWGCPQRTNHSIASTYPAMLKPTILRFDPLLRLSSTYVKYQWYRNGKAIVGANAIAYTMPYSGKYWCEVSDVNDCFTNSDTVDTDNSSSIQSVSATGETIKIYPNPTTSKVWIESNFDVSILVTDMTGKLILKEQNTKEINLSPYADGLYLFTIINKEGTIIGVEKINKLSNN